LVKFSYFLSFCLYRVLADDWVWGRLSPPQNVTWFSAFPFWMESGLPPPVSDPWWSHHHFQKASLLGPVAAPSTPFVQDGGPQADRCFLCPHSLKPVSPRFSVQENVIWLLIVYFLFFLEFHQKGTVSWYAIASPV